MTIKEPKNERFVLVFDFETTGLPKDGNARYHPSESNPDDWPHSLQMAYILYDNHTHTAKIVNEVIQLPQGINVTQESEEIHHISADFSRGKTKHLGNGEYTHHPDIKTVLHEFMKDFKQADVVVAHNIHFDRNMVLVELDRLRIHDLDPQTITFLKEFFENKKEFCTGIKGKYVCKMEKKDKHGRTYYKMPKLKELYATLFGSLPNESMLHDALVDVVLCLRCFYSMRYKKDLYQETDLDPTIKSMIEKLEKDNKNEKKIRKSVRLEKKPAVDYHHLSGKSRRKNK
jgi:DNA polymerase III epsilon subunit-like protein